MSKPKKPAKRRSEFNTHRLSDLVEKSLKPRPAHLCRWWQTHPGSAECRIMKRDRRTYCKECERV